MNSLVGTLAIACLVVCASALPINNRNNFGARIWDRKDGVRVVGEISGDIIDASITFDSTVFLTVSASGDICATSASDGTSKGCLNDPTLVGGCVPAYPTETMRLGWYCLSGSDAVTLYDFTGTPSKSSAGTCSGVLGLGGICSPDADATAYEINVAGGASGVTATWGESTLNLGATRGTVVESFTALDFGSKHYMGILGTDTGLTLIDVNGGIKELLYTPMEGVKSCQGSHWTTGVDTVYAICCTAVNVECRLFSDSGSGLEETTSFTSVDDGTALAIALNDVLVVKDTQFFMLDGLLTDSLKSGGRTTAGTGSSEETTLIVGGERLYPRVLAGSSNGAKILAPCMATDAECQLYSNLGGGDGEYAVPVLVASVLAITIIPSSIYAYRTKKICAKPMSKADSVEVRYDEERGIHYDPHYESYVNQFGKKGRKESI